MTKPNPVVHFEMPYANPARLAKFYTKAFGWKMNKMGKEMGDYVVATTAKTDKNRMIKERGAINGGFTRKIRVHRRRSLLWSLPWGTSRKP